METRAQYLHKTMMFTVFVMCGIRIRSQIDDGLLPLVAQLNGKTLEVCLLLFHNLTLWRDMLYWKSF